MTHVELLQQLAEKLGVAVEYLWPQAVRYTVVSASVNVVFGVLLTVGGYMIAQKARTLEMDDRDLQTVVRILLGILSVVVVAIAIPQLFSVAAVIEPEGYLVKEILKR